MGDLMKLHTYYPYKGDGADVTQYWERMTAVRLQYLADPGPAATALRVEGVWPGTSLIGVDGIGEASADRQRIMPQHAWDWSVPTPFSQGWRVGDKTGSNGDDTRNDIAVLWPHAGGAAWVVTAYLQGASVDDDQRAAVLARVGALADAMIG